MADREANFLAGLERVVMLFLKLGNIRHASLFPRDPRSFPSAANKSAAELAQATIAKEGAVLATAEGAAKQ